MSHKENSRAKPRERALATRSIALVFCVCGVAVLGVCVKGLMFPAKRRSAKVCAAPTRVLAAVRDCAESPVVYDVDRDGDDELITLQTEAPGASEYGQRVFVVAIKPTEGAPLWRARVENSTASRVRNSAALEHLVISAGRVIHIDSRGHLSAIELASGRVVARAALRARIARVCTSPDEPARLWLDGVLSANDTMTDSSGSTISSPRPEWCPDVRDRPLRCRAFGPETNCLTFHDIAPEVPEFLGTFILDNGHFAAAIGANAQSHRVMVVGLSSLSHVPLWSREGTFARAELASIDRGALVGSRVYVPYANSAGFRMAAIELASGSLAWDAPLPCSSIHWFNRQPTGISVSLTRVYLQSEGTTVALDINSGERRWVLSDR